MTRSPTMIDVAREAGVGLATVSRYVNGQTNIRPELAARVGEAITTLGYRRNLAAASIRPGWTSKILGLVISDLRNPYYSALTQAIEVTARERGYLLISASSEEDGAIHDVVIDRLLQQRVDGLIVVPPLSPGRPWSEIPPPVPPLVVLDRPADAPGADVILADDVGGAREATSTLAELGARRIGFVGDQQSLYTMRERLQGYRDALEGHGLEFDERLIAVDAHTFDQAGAAALRMMRDYEPDALFAANNRASIGTLLAFRQLGRRLPLIGFDEFEAAQLGDPPISVVRPDLTDMGRLAAELLIGRVNGSAPPARRYLLPTSLVRRGSEVPDEPRRRSRRRTPVVAPAG